jgi:hypothetical protein
MSLLTLKHPNDDFFIPDLFDQTPFKNDMASMEHPVFVLSMKKDMRLIEYVNGNTTIQIKPSFEGLPNIFDKDFLMYCAGLLMLEVNKGNIPSRTLRVSTHDFLVSTNRPISGQSYNMLKTSLDRLKGCVIKTNIKTNKRETSSAFGMLESYQVIESHKVKNRMIRLEVTLSEWFYNSIVGKEMLTINRNYFRLRKPLERRLYEIARKHCGSQKTWNISLNSLFSKSGSSGSLAKFRFNLKAISNAEHIPDYRYNLDCKDKVTVINKNWEELVESNELLEEKAHKMLSQLQPQTIKNAKKIHDESSTDWSLSEIALQFYQYIQKKGMPENLDKAFIGFLKKKAKEYKKDSVTA